MHKCTSKSAIHISVHLSKCIDVPLCIRTLKKKKNDLPVHVTENRYIHFNVWHCSFRWVATMLTYGIFDTHDVITLSHNSFELECGQTTSNTCISLM